MSIVSDLKLLMSLDPKSWQDIQGFRMSRHGPDRTLCDPEVLDHITGTICRAIQKLVDVNAEKCDDTWGVEIHIDRDGIGVHVWKDWHTRRVDRYESIAEGLLVGYTHCLEPSWYEVLL